MYKLYKDNNVVCIAKTALQAARLINRYTSSSYGLISNEDIRVKARALRQGKLVKVSSIMIKRG